MYEHTHHIQVSSQICLERDTQSYLYILGSCLQVVLHATCIQNYTPMFFFTVHVVMSVYRSDEEVEEFSSYLAMSCSESLLQ